MKILLKYRIDRLVIKIENLKNQPITLKQQVKLIDLLDKLQKLRIDYDEATD